MFSILDDIKNEIDEKGFKEVLENSSLSPEELVELIEELKTENIYDEVDFSLKKAKRRSVIQIVNSEIEFDYPGIEDFVLTSLYINVVQNQDSEIKIKSKNGKVNMKIYFPIDPFEQEL